VKSPASALGQLFRVIRPGGELRFYEHVRSPKPGFARAQRAVDLVWPWFGGGCHTSRDTERAIADAGFVIERIRHFEFRPAPCSAPVSPHIIGVARRP
jgi:ubiquinone/menaquinone biosynthesis C-methylase UbiE